jgi:hypothetical protein
MICSAARYNGYHLRMFAVQGSGVALNNVFESVDLTTPTGAQKVSIGCRNQRKYIARRYVLWKTLFFFADTRTVLCAPAASQELELGQFYLWLSLILDTLYSLVQEPILHLANSRDLFALRRLLPATANLFGPVWISYRRNCCCQSARVHSEGSSWLNSTTRLLSVSFQLPPTLLRFR